MKRRGLFKLPGINACQEPIILLQNILSDINVECCCSMSTIVVYSLRFAMNYLNESVEKRSDIVNNERLMMNFL